MNCFNVEHVSSLSNPPSAIWLSYWQTKSEYLLFKMCKPSIITSIQVFYFETWIFVHKSYGWKKLKSKNLLFNEIPNKGTTENDEKGSNPILPVTFLSKFFFLRFFPFFITKLITKQQKFHFIKAFETTRRNHTN